MSTTNKTKAQLVEALEGERSLRKQTQRQQQKLLQKLGFVRAAGCEWDGMPNEWRQRVVRHIDNIFDNV